MRMKRLSLSVKILLLASALMLLVSGCSGSKWKDGTYTGEADGNNGPVKVSVVIEKGKITSVKVTDHKETKGLCEPAIEGVPKSIVEKQSVEVDTVSGATFTSNAIIEAVTKALESAAK